MIRIIVQTCDAGMALNVSGGIVDSSVESFDIEAPALEKFIAEYEHAKEQAKNKGGLYWHRNIIGGHTISKPGEVKP